jgi:pyruvate kinase
MQGGHIELVSGESIVLTPQEMVGTPERISVSFAGLAGDVRLGERVLLDDGNLILTVESVTPSGEIHCNIVRGGSLSSRRGVNLPGQRVSLPALTDKDLVDMEFAVEHGLDFLALSFVQSADDVRLLKGKLRERNADIGVISKIETKAALDDIEAIAEESYGVMVARGDLALEVSAQDVPIAQKRIIAACRRRARPVITATQMLESMTNSPKPTRAEAADVANAIFDGTDALMLSGESAVGKYPVDAIATMSIIAHRAEQAWMNDEIPPPPESPMSGSMEDVVAQAATMISQSLRTCAMVAYTMSGSTPRLLACHRPPCPILALCPEPAVRRRLALTWGVESALVERIRGTAHMVELACEHAMKELGLEPGDVLTIIAGTPYHVSGSTNLIKIEKIRARQKTNAT